MTRIGIHSTYFYYELGLWFNAKSVDFKSIKQFLTKFMKRFKLYKNARANKNVIEFGH